MTATPPPAVPDTAPAPSVPPARGGFSLDIERRTIPDAIRDYLNRLRSGDPGALPSVLGIVVLLIIFSQVSSRFLSHINIGNLPGQGAYIAVIALGLVFVLLIGEIDLSAGTTGGVCAAFAAQGIFSHGLQHGIPGLLYAFLLAALIAGALLGFLLRMITAPLFVVVGIILCSPAATSTSSPSLIIAISVGTAIGIFTGWLVAKVGIPSFIVTLALFPRVAGRDPVHPRLSADQRQSIRLLERSG